MKQIFFIFLTLNIATAFKATAGQWTLVNPQTLLFEGFIENGELYKFKKVYRKTVTTLEVNSLGGNTHDGIELGLYLKDLNLKIVVNGVCLSSCANYIFTAGTTKYIKNGIVCFHGNVNTMDNSKAEQSLRDQLSKFNPTEEQIKQIIQETMNETNKDKALENRLFSQLGISQELFNRSQKVDKGMNDDNQYHFLCPTPTTFKKYGITGVSGVQNMQIGQSMGMKNLLN